MKEILISQFIDDELSLPEKKDFVINVKNDDEFYDETIKFIDSEIKFIEKIKKNNIPDLKLKRAFYFNYKIAVAAVLFIAITFFGVSKFMFSPQQTTVAKSLKEYRFVIFNNNAHEVKISGTFTNWQKIPMKKINNSGYWELTLSIPEGEHKYSMFADDNVLADPTAAFIEKDDFGNINSVLEV